MFVFLSCQIMGTANETISEGLPGFPCQGRGGLWAQAGCQPSGQETVFAGAGSSIVGP